MKNQIRLGMVGGGDDSFIGNIHRIASRIDDKYTFVAGALSSTEEKSIISGNNLGLNKERNYRNFYEMASNEKNLKDGIEVVSIVTPNNIHYEAAKEFLKNGVHVICDKPLTSNLEDAKELYKIAKKSKSLFMLTHNYTGYPLVRQAKKMIEKGELGNIRVIQVEYPQDWLSKENKTKQALWRTNPIESGPGGCIADIGTHAFNIVSFISNLELDSISADLDTFVNNRKLDDNANVLLRFKGGAKGMLWSSQISPGNENALKIRIFGENGSISWSQEDPNYLWHAKLGKPKQLITRNGHGFDKSLSKLCRIPPGHPEGYLESFANLYLEFASALKEFKKNPNKKIKVNFPTIEDGLNGMEFIRSCIESSENNSQWVKLKSYL